MVLHGMYAYISDGTILASGEFQSHSKFCKLDVGGVHCHGTCDLLTRVRAIGQASPHE